MTCAISAPYGLFNDGPYTQWSGSTTEGPFPSPSSEQQNAYGILTAEPQSHITASINMGKKRASRAGTRSVATLSASQLERKRANDREAQRAIRQRTKDHIDQLEKSINELRARDESSEHLIAIARHRNRELENEIAYLRNKISSAGVALNSAQAEAPPNNNSNMLGLACDSPDNSGLGTSHFRIPTIAERRKHSITTAMPAPPQQMHFASLPDFPPNSSAVSQPLGGASSLANWRSSDGAGNMHPPLQTTSTMTATSGPPILHDSGQAGFGQNDASMRPGWATGPNMSFPYELGEDESRSHGYGQSQPATTTQGGETSFAPGNISGFTQNVSQPQSKSDATTAYANPRMTNREYATIPVSTGVSYQLDQQAQQPTDFSASPVLPLNSVSTASVLPDYEPAASRSMQVPSLAATDFSSNTGQKTSYSSPEGTRSPVTRFRSDINDRSYSVSSLFTGRSGTADNMLAAPAISSGWAR